MTGQTTRTWTPSLSGTLRRPKAASRRRQVRPSQCCLTHGRRSASHRPERATSMPSPSDTLRGALGLTTHAASRRSMFATTRPARLSAGRDVGTVENEVRAAGAVFNWAVRNKLVSTNPFAGMAPRPVRRIGGEGRGYTDDEAAQLLKAARRETGWRRWLAWALCFTGARISEIADLRRRDVRQEAGVWIFDVVPNEARRGKTATFQRMLPIHPALPNEGLLEYVNALPPDGPLWPDLGANTVGSRKDHATTNFGRWVRGRGGLHEEQEAADAWLPAPHGGRTAACACPAGSVRRDHWAPQSPQRRRWVWHGVPADA